MGPILFTQKSWVEEGGGDSSLGVRKTGHINKNVSVGTVRCRGSRPPSDKQIVENPPVTCDGQRDGCPRL